MEERESNEGSGQGYYLFWALLGGALILALGSTAILHKMSERPELAGADPLLQTVLQVARVLAWSIVGVLAVVLVYQGIQGPKR